MQFIKVTFLNTHQDVNDMLIAMLADAGYNGFEEVSDGLLAYIEQPNFHKEELAAIAAGQNVAYATELVPGQNWNALWESNFEPVVVDDFCTIRAHFHDLLVTTPYDIVITPKMSFGTGHHATTQLMIMMMREIDFRGKSVLDFGTGTGVLAIMAEKLGAARITAIDNDEWCLENSTENINRNDCRNITAQQASIENLSKDNFDVILANINRNILVEYMPELFKRLNGGGSVLMSGLLAHDQEVIVKTATENGLHFKQLKERSNWIALLFDKI